MRTALLFAALLIRPPVVTITSIDRVHEICGAEVDACTEFVAYRLIAACNGARIAASVTFEPRVFLRDPGLMAHERLHIDDLQRFAAAYVTDLEQNTYETESECDARRRVEVETFGETMREFALRSNRERH